MCSVFILFSCKEGVLSGKKDEGIIEYKVEAVDKSNPLAGLAPGSATLKFKGNKYLIEMSTMGIFKTTFIYNGNNKTLTEMIKFMDIKNACIESQEDLVKESMKYELKFRETNIKTKLAKYKCHKLIAYYVSHPEDTFEVLYTKDIMPESIYDFSSYKDIKGMLLKYRLKKWGLELEFTADKVQLTEVSDEDFELPSYYKIISKEEMDNFIKSLQ